MCDYSMEAVRSRQRKKGDRLVIQEFGHHHTLGFAEEGGPNDVAICLCEGDIVRLDGLSPQFQIGHSVGQSIVAQFHRVNQHVPMEYHDGFLLANGHYICVQDFDEDVRAHVEDTVADMTAPPRQAQPTRRPHHTPVPPARRPIRTRVAEAAVAVTAMLLFYIR